MAKAIYRGEDKTLEMIKSEVGPQMEHSCDKLYKTKWNETCISLANKFRAENLPSTASTIMGHQRLR